MGLKNHTTSSRIPLIQKYRINHENLATYAAGIGLGCEYLQLRLAKIQILRRD